MRTSAWLARSGGSWRTLVILATRQPGEAFLAQHLGDGRGAEDGSPRALIDAAAESYVVIMHYQRTLDRDALAAALASRARYIGVLGPARRMRDLRAEIGRRVADNARIHVSIGLDLGAKTPAQIALSVVGELHAIARRAQGENSVTAPELCMPACRWSCLPSAAHAVSGAPRSSSSSTARRSSGA
ncbi:XdhC family protein [Sorangium sp. So ce260]|uniref:XdhC family protein n=1 Tax=Sorangium sp. So ce260 TaxID=3133291 RepID=UPI003F63A437